MLEENPTWTHLYWFRSSVEWERVLFASFCFLNFFHFTLDISDKINITPCLKLKSAKKELIYRSPNWKFDVKTGHLVCIVILRTNSENRESFCSNTASRNHILGKQVSVYATCNCIGGMTLTLNCCQRKLPDSNEAQTCLCLKTAHLLSYNAPWGLNQYVV